MQTSLRLTAPIRFAAYRLLPNYGRKKIFAIGFNKTGTTSLHGLFESLGYRSYHGTEWRDTTNMRLLVSYECFSDGVPDDFKRLDRLFPGSRFILQVRNLDEWINSRLEHIERTKKAGAFVRKDVWDTTDFAVQSWIRSFTEHHKDVLSYFADSPRKLLVVNFIRDELAAHRVCDFLGFDANPGKPHLNRNPERDRALKHRERIRASCVALGIPEAEWKNDILCPSLLPPSERGKYPGDTAELPDSPWRAVGGFRS